MYGEQAVEAVSYPIRRKVSAVNSFQMMRGDVGGEM